MTNQRPRRGLFCPEDLVGEYGELTPDIKRKILGLNAARLYDVSVPVDIPRPSMSETGPEVSEKPAVLT